MGTSSAALGIRRSGCLLSYKESDVVKRLFYPVDWLHGPIAHPDCRFHVVGGKEHACFSGMMQITSATIRYF